MELTHEFCIFQIIHVRVFVGSEAVTKEEILRDDLKKWKFIVKNQREFYKRRMIPITRLEAVSSAAAAAAAKSLQSCRTLCDRKQCRLLEKLL